MMGRTTRIFGLAVVLWIALGSNSAIAQRPRTVNVDPRRLPVLILRNGTTIPDVPEGFRPIAVFDPENNNNFPVQEQEEPELPLVDYDDEFGPEPLPTARPSRRPASRRPSSRRPSRRNRNGTAGPVFVIGSAITSSTENFGRIKSGFSRRSKRQASTLPVASPSRPRFLTDTQRRFAFLNDNFPEALRMQLSRLVQRDPDLRRDIKVDRRGITCNDVCTPNSVGFGLIGFCSNVYCICDTREDEPEDDSEEPEFGQDRDSVSGGRTRRHQIARCPSDQVFDPNRFVCDRPEETDLCSDDPPDNPDVPEEKDDLPVSTGWKPKRKSNKPTRVVYVGWEAPTASPASWAPTTIVRQLQPSYGAPAAWSQSQPQPQALYAAPAPEYGAPVAAPVQQQYGAPVQQVQQQYAAPVQQAQGYSISQQYGAPTPVYKAPAPLSLDSYLNAAVESHQGKSSGQIINELNLSNNGHHSHSPSELSQLQLPISTQKKRSS